MKPNTFVVVTSISPPNFALKKIASGCVENGVGFIVVGDEASPSDFELQGCDFYSLQDQQETPFSFSRICPKRHYSRKNIGYLIAIHNGAQIILETDDDNIPSDNFWDYPDDRKTNAFYLEHASWVNVYKYFSEALIWPRGFPLDLIHQELPAYDESRHILIDCPIQQGLANQNPDVDAIYRLLLPLPQDFESTFQVALGQGSICPFNSQNTRWWSDAFPLLYLPSYCSFRMTDIWRSFVAQIIAWKNNWSVLFHHPTVYQERNEHNLMEDFAKEVDGYLNNLKLVEELMKLPLQPGVDNLGKNLILCYEKLISMSLIGHQELELLDAFLHDLDSMQSSVG